MSKQKLFIVLVGAFLVYLSLGVWWVIAVNRRSVVINNEYFSLDSSSPQYRLGAYRDVGIEGLLNRFFLPVRWADARLNNIVYDSFSDYAEWHDETEEDVYKWWFDKVVPSSSE